MTVFASAIIPAAGSGERLAGPAPKQFRELGGRPLIVWSAVYLAETNGVRELIVGAAAERVDEMRELLSRYLQGRKVKVVVGGATRQDTVRQCLAAADSASEVVVIHDAARPFVREELIAAAIAAAARTGAATVAVRPSDTIKIEHGSATENLDRTKLWQIQTPQAFRTVLIRKAHEQAVADGFTGTDDTALVERIGSPVEFVPGNAMNLKITTPEDWKIAQALVRSEIV